MKRFGLLKSVGGSNTNTLMDQSGENEKVANVDIHCEEKSRGGVHGKPAILHHTITRKVGVSETTRTASFS
jgi:hypothetical protein